MNERAYLSATEIDWVDYAEEYRRFWFTLPRLFSHAHVNGFVFKVKIGDSLVVQGLGLCALSAKGPGLIPVQGI